MKHNNIHSHIENLFWLLIGAFAIPYFYPLLTYILRLQRYAPIWFVQESVRNGEYIYAFQFMIPILLGCICKILLIVELLKLTIHIFKNHCT